MRLSEQCSEVNNMELWQLQQLQSLPLDIKIEKTKLRIKEWYEAFGICYSSREIYYDLMKGEAK